jgi:hypothetical protein
MEEIHHIRHDHHTEEEWGGWKEVLFWVVALLANLGFIVYAAWRLAVRHTDATGSSILVPAKYVQDDSAGQSTAVQNDARRRGGKQALPQ